MRNRTFIFLFLFIMLCFFLITVSGCDTDDSVIPDTIETEEIIEEEQITLSEEDFAFEIGTLPYRGAVLFINYEGEVDLSDYNLFFDVTSDGEIKQEKMAVEELDGEFVATIVDLMYLPGDELDFVIKIQDSSGIEIELHYSGVLERYPWKDWMMDLEEPVLLYTEQVGGNFNYNNPNHFLGAHSSWDFWTRPGEEVGVYCGTLGVVNRIVYEHDNIEIYNPYVGAIVQYGHTFPTENLFVGKDVNPGDLIAYTVPEDRHIHYSVIRPYYYTSNPRHAPASINISKKWDTYYWPIIWTQDKFIYHDNLDGDVFSMTE